MNQHNIEHKESYKHQKTCHSCYRTFGARRADAKYCSAKCRMAAHRERQPKRTIDEITADRLYTKRTRRYKFVCLNCGETFYRDGTGTASRYCTNACKQKAYRHRQATTTLFLDT